MMDRMLAEWCSCGSAAGPSVPQLSVLLGRHGHLFGEGGQAQLQLLQIVYTASVIDGNSLLGA